MKFPWPVFETYPSKHGTNPLISVVVTEHGKYVLIPLEHAELLYESVKRVVKRNDFASFADKTWKAINAKRDAGR